MMKVTPIPPPGPTDAGRSVAPGHNHHTRALRELLLVSVAGVTMLIVVIALEVVHAFAGRHLLVIGRWEIDEIAAFALMLLALGVFATRRWSQLRRESIEHMRAEEEARETRLMLEDIAQGITESVMLVSKDYRILWANRATQEQTGREVEELVGSCCYAVTHLRDQPCEPPLDPCPIQQLQATGKTETVVHTHFGAEGQKIDVEVAAYPVTDEGGQIASFVHISRDITESRRAEEALRESEERHRDLYEEAPNAYWSVGVDGRIQIANRRSVELLGYGMEELIGKPVLDLYADTPAGKEKAQGVFQRFLAGEEIREEELEMRGADGRQVWVRVSVRPIRDSQGSVVASRSIVVDITERKRTEEALRESEEWLSTTLRSIGDAVIATDRDGRVTLMNPAAQALTGWEEEEAVGRPLKDIFNIVNEKTGEQVEDPVAKVLRQGLVVGLANHTALIAKDGTRRSIADSGAPVRDSDGNITGVALIFRDVTERRRAEEALRESEERFRSTLDSMMEGCVIIGFDWRYLYINTATRERPHRPQGETLGRTMMEVYPSLEEMERYPYYRRCLEERIPHRMESEFTYPDGAKVWFDVSIQPVPEGMVILSQDITERKRMEEALQHARDELEGKVERQHLRRNPYGLTFRELTVLHLVAAGDSDRQIALTLTISHLTAQKHVSNILEKMQVASRTEASVRAVREGLLE